MKTTAFIGTSILGLLLWTAPSIAQHGHEGEHQGDPQRQHENGHQNNDHRHQSAEHSERHRDGPQRQHQYEQHGHEHQPQHEQQAHHGPDHRLGPPHEEYRHQAAPRPVHDVWQPHRAEHWQREHHNWRERGGYHGERIPEGHFHEHFGRARWFRVHNVPVIVVNSRPRFQYGGYWFTLVDPWPEYWSAAWYRTDDVCIDYVNDGYYMYNRLHPGVAIAVSVSF